MANSKLMNTVHAESCQQRGNLLTNSSPSSVSINAYRVLQKHFGFFPPLSDPFLLGPSELQKALQGVNQAAGDIVAVWEDPHL